LVLPASLFLPSITSTPPTLDPLSAPAVSVTRVPESKSALQVLPQLIPAGLLIAVPLPLPAFTTVRVNSWMKVAVTLRACVMLTTHVPVPSHPSPLQPVKWEPLVAMAVSVTLVSWSKAVRQVAPQSIPAGVLVTAPLPLPVLLTVRGTCGMKSATTGVLAVKVTVQGPVPVHPPPFQPIKRELVVAT